MIDEKLTPAFEPLSEVEAMDFFPVDMMLSGYYSIKKRKNKFSNCCNSKG